MAEKKNEKNSKSMLSTTVLLALVAIIAATAASLAWFTISDNGRVNSMLMDVTAGLALRIDTVPHEHFEEYTQHLQLDMSDEILLPVTSSDGQTFRLEHGELVETAQGYYIEHELHFMSTMDMWVHLLSDDSEDADDGTELWSNDNSNLRNAMRMSFTWDDETGSGTFIYNPRTSDLSGYTEENTMFFLEAETDKTVMVRIWLEGNDPNCKNDLKNIEYSIKMKFEGTDDDNNRLQ